MRCIWSSSGTTFCLGVSELLMIAFVPVTEDSPMRLAEFRIRDMRIDLGRHDARVAEHFLYGAYIRTVREECRCKRMSERMGGYWLIDARSDCSLPDHVGNEDPRETDRLVIEIRIFRIVTAVIMPDEEGRKTVIPPIEVLIDPSASLGRDVDGPDFPTLSADTQFVHVVSEVPAIQAH